MEVDWAEYRVTRDFFTINAAELWAAQLWNCSRLLSDLGPHEVAAGFVGKAAFDVLHASLVAGLSARSGMEMWDEKLKAEWNEALDTGEGFEKLSDRVLHPHQLLEAAIALGYTNESSVFQRLRVVRDCVEHPKPGSYAIPKSDMFASVERAVETSWEVMIASGATSYLEDDVIEAARADTVMLKAALALLKA